MGYSISPASLRLDDLHRADRDACCRTAASARITIAPETGSDRLRRVINKTVTNDEILDRAELIFASGIENLKLYYMIGLPTETDEDLVAIRDLTLQLRDVMMKHARPRGQHRPNRRQRQPAGSQAGHGLSVAADGRSGVIERKIKRLRALIAGIDNVYFNIKSRAAFVLPGAAVAGRPARGAGDRSGRAQRPASGARRWPKPASTPTSTSSATASDDAVLPWDIIDGGMKASFFRAEFEKSAARGMDAAAEAAQENARLLPVLT